MEIRKAYVSLLPTYHMVLTSSPVFPCGVRVAGRWTMDDEPVEGMHAIIIISPTTRMDNRCMYLCTPDVLLYMYVLTLCT